MRKLTHEDCNVIFSHLPINLKRQIMTMLCEVVAEAAEDPGWKDVLLWVRVAYKKLPAFERKEPKYKASNCHDKNCHR